MANEESKTDILCRIACLHLGYNFNDWKKGVMPVERQKECAILFPEIAKYVKILDATYKNGLTTRLEGVQNALNAVQEADFSACLIDYYQLIIHSTEDPNRGRYDVLNRLRIFFQRYIKTSNIPIVLFAQLHSLGKRASNELDSRIKECPTILETATVAIECVPNHEGLYTDFVIRKDRWGLQGSKVRSGFKNGRFINYNDDFKKWASQKRIDKLQDNIPILDASKTHNDNPYLTVIKEQHNKLDDLVEDIKDEEKQGDKYDSN